MNDFRIWLSHIPWWVFLIVAVVVGVAILNQLAKRSSRLDLRDWAAAHGWEYGRGYRDGATWWLTSTHRGAHLSIAAYPSHRPAHGPYSTVAADETIAGYTIRLPGEWPILRVEPADAPPRLEPGERTAGFTALRSPQSPPC